MSELLDDFQEALCSPNPYYEALISKIREQQQEISVIDSVRSYGLLRLCQALQHYNETGQGSSDILVLIRQVIRSYQQRLKVPQQLWKRLMKKEVETGLRPVSSEHVSEIELTADDWEPAWLDNAGKIDILQQRRNEEPVLGDGILYAMTNGKFTSYQSLAQRVAIHACFFTEPGSTLLITLPTGAGKSLSVLLPAWYESEGGLVKGGTTIVVVPTVSLALDQEQRARLYFTDTDEEYRPYSWTGDTSPTTKAIIRQGVRNGTIPLLYISPESLVQTDLYNICLECAERGTLKRLVIDEAHLIATWGAGFRTEFQFLATYRELLLDRSHGQLKTLMLSATISREDITLLRNLFSRNSPFQYVRANRLRPEPSYWFRFTQSETTRMRRVIEALHHLPRPLILYVSRPEEANVWVKTLRNEGFHRIATFTGDTKAEDRKKHIVAWSNSEIDIMVATSAFGVGIDKSDVRTILHACSPENLDRFYQEVGRAGRDGYSAIALSCPTLQDYEMAFGMTKSARITVEQAINRWEGMRITGTIVQGSSDVQVINTDAPPINDPEMMQSNANREWNEHTLLLMQRAKLIQIMDTRERVSFHEEMNESNEVTPRINRMQIRLLDPMVTANPDGAIFYQKLEQARNAELEKIRSNLNDMQSLVSKYGSAEVSQDSHSHSRNLPCIAYNLIPLYPGCARACGGCASCRKNHNLPYEDPLPLVTDIEEGETRAYYLHDELSSLMGTMAAINVVWDRLRYPLDSTNLSNLLVDLVWAGIQQLIIPPEFMHQQKWSITLQKKLAEQTHPIPHHILSSEEITNYQEIPLYAIPTAIIYPTEDKSANILYNHLQKQIQRWNKQSVPLIHVFQQALVLDREHGRFRDRINGITELMPHMSLLLKQWQQPIF